MGSISISEKTNFRHMVTFSQSAINIACFGVFFKMSLARISGGRYKVPCILIVS